MVFTVTPNRSPTAANAATSAILATIVRGASNRDTCCLNRGERSQQRPGSSLWHHGCGRDSRAVPLGDPLARTGPCHPDHPRDHHLLGLNTDLPKRTQ